GSPSGNVDSTINFSGFSNITTLKISATTNSGVIKWLALDDIVFTSLGSAAPTTTISTAAFSADTGTSSTDFITKTAAQTISGTTSANLASGESVQVSLDNGTTWNTATSSVGSNVWSYATTLTASNTLQVRVIN